MADSASNFGEVLTNAGEFMVEQEVNKKKIRDDIIKVDKL
jgi:hypothetical protein